MSLKVSLSTLLIALSAIANNAAIADAPTPASYALCMACHGPDGKGIPAGALLMAPSLHGSALVNAGDGELLASVILTGIVKEDQKYLGMMAPLAAALNSAQLTEVMNYLRQNFDNKAEPVTEEQVQGWITKYAGQPSRKRADLEALAAP